MADIPSEQPQPKLDEVKPAKWKRQVARLFRRKWIAEGLEQKKTITEIKTQVRQREQEANIPNLLESFETSMPEPPPEITDFATELSEILKARFPSLAAIVILGSGSSSGGKIRKAMDAEIMSDLDWGIITNGPINEQKVYDIINEAEKHLEELAKRHGLNPEMHTCLWNSRFPWTGINPLRRRAVQLHNATELLPLLREDDILLERIDTLTLYFEQSFPRAVNQQNRKIFLETLKELGNNNSRQLDKVIFYLVDEWKSHHSLKDKHFQIAETDRDGDILDVIVMRSPEILARPFERLLESVKESTRHWSD